MTTKMLAALGAALALTTLTMAPAGAVAARDSSAVFAFADFSTVGTSSLTRDASGVSMSLHTTRLSPDHAVTVWWVVFNHPEHCRTKLDNPAFPFRCGEPDLSNPDAHPSVLYAAGHVIGGDGTASYRARLTAGDATGAGLEPSQINSADIHLVLHDHGPADPSLMPDQIRSFDVCNTTCVDVQASVHEAV